MKMSSQILVRRAGAFALSMSYFSMHSETECELDRGCLVNFEKNQTLSNWSATHSLNAKKVYEPLNERELIRLLAHHQDSNSKIRPIGTLLSPNGIALPDPGGSALSMHHFDSVSVDPDKMTVTVGSGASVRNVLNALSAYGLTLENFSSIQEQQMAGWTQVAAHGTGCGLPTVEEQIVEMKIATPAEGILTLSDAKLPRLYRLAKVGLGSVGVVTELTLRCIPKLNLKEDTIVLQRDDVSDGHYDRLRQCRHVRYMWIPYTSCVVSVTSNPAPVAKPAGRPTSGSSSSGHASQALVDLILSKAAASPSSSLSLVMETTPRFLYTQSFAQLRDIALGSDPLSLENVKRVNQAEAKYWEASQGSRVGDSTDILGFDCGGEQWVLEMCFPIGSLDEETYADVSFVRELLELVEMEGIPAPGPIEQRWTARSTSPMSPAFSENPKEKFCWVGVIMYTPASQTQEQREDIRRAFVRYCKALDPLLLKYKAQLHWAKLEPPLLGNHTSPSGSEIHLMRERIHSKYPVDEFKSVRNVLDPKGILSNSLVETFLN